MQRSRRDRSALLDCEVPQAVGTQAVANAAPDLSPLVNTTCTYEQLVAGLNAVSPAMAAQFTANPFGPRVTTVMFAGGYFFT